MKKLLIAGIILFALITNTKAEENRITYEYASFSSMGNKSSIIWSDGSVLRIEDKYKRPDGANEKMFYMTMAFNIFEREGFQLVMSDTTPTFMYAAHENDLMFRRKLSFK